MKANRFLVLSAFALLVIPSGQMAFHFFPPQFLYGVQETSRRALPTPGKCWSGAFQNQMEKWFNQNYGTHDYLVKTNRQLFYSLFGDLKNNEGIILGKNQQLLCDAYVKHTLQFGPPLRFEAMVGRLAQINRLVRRRGHHFLVLVTPSKSSLYPDDIPPAYTRFPHFEPGANYRNFIGALRENHIPCLDLMKTTADLAAISPHRLFPRGGIHWNDQAAALGAQKLLEKLKSLSGRPIGRLDPGPAVFDDKPAGSDVDYALLLNLWRPPLDFEGVHLPQVRAEPGPDYGRLTFTMQGGSFTTRIYAYFSELGFFKKNTRVFYHLEYINGFQDKPREMEGFSWKEQALDRDFLVLEVNDALLWSDDPANFFQKFSVELLEHLESSR